MVFSNEMSEIQLYELITGIDTDDLSMDKVEQFCLKKGDAYSIHLFGLKCLSIGDTGAGSPF